MRTFLKGLILMLLSCNTGAPSTHEGYSLMIVDSNSFLRTCKVTALKLSMRFNDIKVTNTHFSRLIYQIDYEIKEGVLNFKFVNKEISDGLLDIPYDIDKNVFFSKVNQPKLSGSFFYQVSKDKFLLGQTCSFGNYYILCKIKEPYINDNLKQYLVNSILQMEMFFNKNDIKGEYVKKVNRNLFSILKTENEHHQEFVFQNKNLNFSGNCENGYNENLRLLEEYKNYFNNGDLIHITNQKKVISGQDIIQDSIKMKLIYRDNSEILEGTGLGLNNFDCIFFD